MKGNISKTKRRHHRHGPVESGYPAEITTLVGHQNMKKNRIETDNKSQESKKLPEHTEVSSGGLILQEVDQLRGEGFHRDEGTVRLKII